MQTFLPSSSFSQSAKWLDNQRLGKQRVEVLQILKSLTNPEYGWQHHPAVKMWRGYEDSLVDYGVNICNEWIARGYNDTCKNKIIAFYTDDYTSMPSWLTPEFTSNHRSILLGKAWDSYSLVSDKCIIALHQKNVKEHPKMIKSASGKLEKSWQVLNWYQSLGWLEQPAQKVEGKWPYIWPVG